MAKNTRFSVVRGDSFILPMQLSYSDGSYMDLTDLTFTGSLQESYTSTTQIPFTFTTVDAASGSLSITLETETLTAGEYVYTMFVISGSVRRTLIDGQFNIRQSTL